MKTIHQQIGLDIEWNHQKSTQYYNNKRQVSKDLKVGSYVYLKRRTIGKNEYNIQTKRRSTKLDCVHLGPFKITDKLKNDNYRLALPVRMRIHPEFHISLLEPTNNTQTKESDEAFDEFEVEAIVGKRVSPSGKTEYRVRWTGYTENDDTWEETTNLYCPDLVRMFEDSIDSRKRRSSKDRRYL
jgi:Chromo (CHRromatin Organisation MOdifier) domain